jgi:prophage regulatory protein
MLARSLFWQRLFQDGRTRAATLANSCAYARTTSAKPPLSKRQTLRYLNVSPLGWRIDAPQPGNSQPWEVLPEMRDTDERLLRLRDVKQKTGLGTSTIYRRIADSTFPAPRSLGPNTVRWLESEIDAWIRPADRRHP